VFLFLIFVDLFGFCSAGSSCCILHPRPFKSRGFQFDNHLARVYLLFLPVAGDFLSGDRTNLPRRYVRLRPFPFALSPLWPVASSTLDQPSRAVDEDDAFVAPPQCRAARYPAMSLHSIQFSVNMMCIGEAFDSRGSRTVIGDESSTRSGSPLVRHLIHINFVDYSCHLRVAELRRQFAGSLYICCVCYLPGHHCSYLYRRLLV
jgi:hypothetical protein